LEGVIPSLFGTLFTTERTIFGGPAAWIESVTAECREKLAPLFQFTAGERAFLDGVLDRGEIDASPMGVPESERRDRSLSGVAMEGAEVMSLGVV
jgi:hypothetical protein